jgi:DNA-binding beta-propeller fold protein YncE
LNTIASQRGQAADKPANNPFAYNISHLQKTDPKLIAYEETARWKAPHPQARRLAIGHDETLYVCSGNYVNAMNLAGDGGLEIAFSEPPRCVVPAKDGKIFVGLRDHVEVFDAKGVRKATWDSPGKKPWLTGLAVTDNDVFVADAGNHKVWALNLDGREQAVWGGLGEGRAQFRGPFRLAQDSFDRVLVTDALNSRILAFTPRGNPLAVIGEFGTTEGTLFRPAGVAVLGGDRVLVTDNYFGSLQLFDSRGAYQGVLCGSDGRPLALENPTGVAARGSTIYVVEMGAGRVSAWEINTR